MNASCENDNSPSAISWQGFNKLHRPSISKSYNLGTGEAHFNVKIGCKALGAPGRLCSISTRLDECFAELVRNGTV
jgi:hypothetical protein